MVSFRPLYRFNRALGRHVFPVEGSGMKRKQERLSYRKKRLYVNSLCELSMVSGVNYEVDRMVHGMVHSSKAVGFSCMGNVRFERPPIFSKGSKSQCLGSWRSGLNIA